MTILHLVRHGETVWHAENRYAGWSDVSLTQDGHAQGDRLARWARGTTIDVLASSDLSRASETAAKVADAISKPSITDPRLREVNFGRGEGLTKSEMMEQFPDEYRRFEAAPASHPLPDGEAPARAVERASRALVDLERLAHGGSILVVAHTTLIRLLISTYLGLPLDDYRRRFPSINNVAVTTVSLPSLSDVHGQGSLLRFNAPPP